VEFNMRRCAIGIDFDERTVRVMVVDIRGGEIAQAAQPHDALADAYRDAVGGLSEADQLIGAGFSLAPGVSAETISPLIQPEALREVGLPPGIPLFAPAINGRAAVPGAGVAAPSTMVLNFAGPGPHLMNSRTKAVVEGITSGVEDAILPGYFGYEIAHPCAGGAAQELRLSRDQREALELRRVCEAIRTAGVPVRRFVAIRPPPQPNVLQTYADVLDARINVAAAEHPRVLGAAILGCLAAGSEASGFANLSQVIHAMAPQRRDLMYRPDLQSRRRYDQLYRGYADRA
jgi:ribulose kinase